MNKFSDILESELNVERPKPPPPDISLAAESGEPIPPHLSDIKDILYDRKNKVYLTEVD